MLLVGLIVKRAIVSSGNTDLIKSASITCLDKVVFALKKMSLNPINTVTCKMQLFLFDAFKILLTLLTTLTSWLVAFLSLASFCRYHQNEQTQTCSPRITSAALFTEHVFMLHTSNTFDSLHVLKNPCPPATIISQGLQHHTLG